MLLPAALRAQATPAEQRMRMYDQHVALQREARLQGARWMHLGPTNISGRSTDVDVVLPKGPNYTIFVAAASGGVWRSRNEGTSWQPVFEHGPSTSIGDVTVAPSDPGIVWIGTGEANIFRSSMAGAGVFKSTDGGDTFTSMGLAGTHTIARILVHPTNPDIVYVSASGHEWTDNEDRGVYKTTDGGRTWQKIHFVNASTGAIDLVMHPTDHNTLYAATWQRVRRKWNDPRNEAGYSGTGIWKTTDGGANWRQVNEGLPAPPQRGRIGIDIARNNPDVLYAFIDNYDIARQPEAGQTDAYGRPAGPVIRGASVFRTDNGGTSWRQVSEDSPVMERMSGTYGWVFGQIRVDPNDAERIYVMGLGLNLSEDGGKTFRQLRGMHGDHHGLFIDPANSGYLVNANDGGVYVSYDHGENWRFFVEIPAVQFFNVAHDMASPFQVYGSIQDHGSRRGVVDLSQGRTRIPAVEWENAPGGEGSNHAIDPRDPDVVYSAGFYGNISRTHLSTDTRENVTPQPGEGERPFRGQWLAPFILSPHNPDVLYHGFNMLHRSMDRGSTWERISDDLTHNDPAKYGDIPYQTIYSIAESPLRFGLVYAGTDDGRAHVTQDGGKTWTEISAGLPAGKFIAEIVASAYDEATVYLAQNGKRDDDFTPYLWKSTDRGRTWTSIAANIPSGPINVVKEDPKRSNVLYLGTDLGAYVTIDGGRRWEALNAGLPTTFVHDIVIHPREDIMVAATHGRGMFALDVRPLQQLTPEIVASNAHVLVSPEPARLTDDGPAIEAAIYYWVGRAGPVQLTIADGAGRAIREVQETATAGLNRYVWDLATTGAPRGGQGGGGRFGRQPQVQPGIYSVQLRAGAATANGVVQVSR
jgi:photosystem II stability/assembly factor-like uncharacterized protein